jgi:hypothetical protein
MLIISVCGGGTVGPSAHPYFHENRMHDSLPTRMWGDTGILYKNIKMSCYEWQTWGGGGVKTVP